MIGMLPDEPWLYDALLCGWLGLAAVVFVTLWFLPAPYGRFARAGWGPRIPAKLAWVVMESPAVIVMAVLFALGDRRSAVPVVLLCLWNLHYLHRTIVYPWRMRSARGVPLVVMASGMVFNVVNAYLQGRYLFALGPAYATGRLLDGRFLAGAALFGVGFVINLHSDAILRSLRLPGDDTYRVPRGGLFRWVSCPNYFGEIVEWSGWALMTWSVPGLAFAVWTAANLLPRAVFSHRWYRRRFADYPPRRKAVIPLVL